MKKKIVVAAIVALMGVGGYLGHRSQTLTNAGESDLLLANAEALSQGESTLEFGCFHQYVESDRPFEELVIYSHQCERPCTPILIIRGWNGDTCK
jgi:hypothetical protein